MKRNERQFTLFTRRTNEPKLNYIESRLEEAGIMFKREGESFHAPCLYVETKDLHKANEILCEKWTKGKGPSPLGRTTLDDIPDDDRVFAEWEAYDDSTPQQMGWVGQDGLP